MSDERCPTCGSPVTVASGDEGTSYYVPGSDERRIHWPWPDATPPETVLVWRAEAGWEQQYVPASRLAEAQDLAERATVLAEKYGEAIVKISETLPNVNRARAIIVGLDTAEEA